MSKAGANVQVIPGGEIYLALERGAIDATEWVGPYDDEILGFNKVAKYYYAPGWHEPGPTLGTYVNLDVYNSLPADIQAAIQQASKGANMQMLADYDAKNGPALQRIIDAGGVELRTFPTEVLTALEGYANTLYAEYADSSPMFAKVWPEWVKFRDAIRGWHRISEQAYLNYSIR
jgi:TRAP-type mannitol/chloroaromatic compound transport system substrate-binding protein